MRVREFLQELVARSNGKVHLHVIDPQPFSEEEDRAAELGVRGVPLGGAGGQFYFGLAGTNSTDGREAIEFFEGLEADNTRAYWQDHKQEYEELVRRPMTGTDLAKYVDRGGDLCAWCQPSPKINGPAGSWGLRG